MSFQAGSVGVSAPRAMNVVFNLNQGAATYNLATATGDVWIEIVGAHVKAAGVGFTTVALGTDHTTPKVTVAAVAVAALVLDLVLTVAISSFLLPSGKHLTGTLVGAGSGGEIDTYVRWTPMTSGATLS